MAKKVMKSRLAAKLGNKWREAFDAHKGDAVSYGAGADLPAGIEGGIAQLVDCHFGIYEKGPNEGEFFFYAAGVVKEPKEHSGIPIEGLRTSIMEPVCDTPDSRGARITLEDHTDWVLNELRKLGVETTDLGSDDLEDTAAALMEAQPHFRFRTWQGNPTKEYPNPRVNHQWRGACEYTDAGEDAIMDETGGPTADDSEEEQEGEGQNLAELAAAADGKDKEAQLKMTELAEAAKIDPNEYETWVDVAAALEQAGGGVEEGEDEEEKPDPEKGEIYLYKPPKARKAVECKVLAVFAGKRTCNLKNLDDNQVYKAVSWDALEGE